jgi:hypothetical protein
MARLPLAAFRRIPWATVITVGTAVAREAPRRWERLTKREQQELVRILRKFRGRPGNVTPAERDEARRIVWKAIGPER